MAFFDYNAQYATPAFPHAQPDEHAWVPAAPLGLVSMPQYQPIAVYDALPQPPCTQACCIPPEPAPAPTPQLPSVPVYNVSYSLAGALTPVDTPRPTLPEPLPSPAPWGACYSPDVPSSGEEYFYEPESSTSGSSCSLSPSPPPFNPPPFVIAVKEEELPQPSLSDSLSRKGRPRREKVRGGSLIVTGDQQFVCDICGTTFIRKHDGERHRRSHTGERPFPCHGGCGKAFRRADARSRHWGVYRECEWRHTLFLEGTPEGARRERRLLKRAKRTELVLQGVARPMIERILKKM